jgi:Viral BACON domain
VPSQPIGYTLSVSPAAPWLALANGTTTPDSITVSLTSAALTLSPGSYQTTITATCTSNSCSGNSQTVTVSLTVTATPPQLQISTGLLSFATTNAVLGPLSQPINIQNSGGGSLGFASVSCEATWCTAGPVLQSLAGGVSAAIPVTVNPSLLTPGFYRTQVDIASSGGKGYLACLIYRPMTKGQASIRSRRGIFRTEKSRPGNALPTPPSPSHGHAIGSRRNS